MSWLKRLFTNPKAPISKGSGKVEFDTDGVQFSHPFGELQEIRSDELDEVGIVTTDEGPFVEDVYFMLLDQDRKGCAIPQAADGNEALFSRLQLLPGFDNGAAIEAMGSTSNQSFRLWKRSADKSKMATPRKPSD